MSTTELKLNGTTVLSENNSTINLVTTTATIGSNALVVASDGNVGIGTTTPSSKLVVVDGNQTIESSDANGYTRFTHNQGNAQIGLFRSGNSVGGGYIGANSDASFMVMNSSFVEQMRLSSTGGLAIGITTTGNYALSVSRSENQPIVAFVNSATSPSGPGCIQTSLNGSNQNNTSCHHFKATTQAVASWYLYGNGTSSFSSDEKLKKNVETTRDGYIEDIKNLRVVKYHWKDQDETTPKELGLIAQEVEQVFPGLIQEHELESVGEDIKHIKMSVLPIITIKAMQEQQTIIESQQTQIDALTARIEALESN